MNSSSALYMIITFVLIIDLIAGGSHDFNTYHITSLNEVYISIK